MTWLIAPDPDAPRLTRAVTGTDHEGREIYGLVTDPTPDKGRALGKALARNAEKEKDAEQK